MKKNWLQIISLALNAVLLAALVLLGGKVDDLHGETMGRLDQVSAELDLVQERVGAIRETQREQTECIEDHRFVPDTVNAETGALDGSMELTLRRWAADTTVDLLATVDGELWTFPMTGTDGVFTAAVSLPLDKNGELRFEAAITSQGVTVREDVTGYSSLSMLLPLRDDGGSWGGPEYRDGVLEVEGYDVDIKKQYGTDVLDPVLRVMKNGVTVQEVPAVISDTAKHSDPNKASYAPNTADETLRVDCENGDTIEIHLLCQDSFGLSYDFFTNGWSINGNDAVARLSPDCDSDVQVSRNS